MALNTQIRATCLLLLLLVSLTSGLVLPPETRQLADLQTQDTAGDAAGLTPVLQRLRRDTHIPTCVFCCGCCGKAGCGLCCRT
ncbi:hepcidin [Balaenoptera acutorostrata]|uniref:Hepcidin n=1 Tax=Balaenoptera acutorostrata TaxID=9767 RepID=A0A383YQW0_BALAC|nr:hepcidin [Balaenoptera acutorostrata]